MASSLCQKFLRHCSFKCLKAYPETCRIQCVRWDRNHGDSCQSVLSVAIGTRTPKFLSNRPVSFGIGIPEIPVKETKGTGTATPEIPVKGIGRYRDCNH